MNNSDKTIILIPARIGSTRLPKKPLLKIDGKEMVLKVGKRPNVQCRFSYGCNRLDRNR